jgi:hypothetical protein
MNNQNKQFENNIYRLLKSRRKSNMPTDKFTHDLISDVLYELKTDQHKRQKEGKNIRLKKWNWLEIAAVFLICGGMVGLLVNQLGSRIESKMNSLSSEIEESAEPLEQPDVPEQQKLE